MQVNPVSGAATVDKAIDLLFHLHRQRLPKGPTSIARGLGMPKSSVHRLLRALSRRGLVERDADGLYRSGIGLVALGLGALEGEPVVSAARQPLEELADAVGETLFLVAARSGRLCVLHKSEGTSFLRAAPRVGSSVPVHATAVGKLYLAFAPELVRDSAAQRTRFTPLTPVDDQRLRLSVDRVREQGWAENRDEWILGLSVLAAPVQLAGRLVAAVALAATTPRLQVLRADGAVDKVRQLGARVADRLGGLSL